MGGGDGDAEQPDQAKTKNIISFRNSRKCQYQYVVATKSRKIRETTDSRTRFFSVSYVPTILRTNNTTGTTYDYVDKYYLSTYLSLRCMP